MLARQAEEGNEVKKIALLSVVALMLVSAIFAPVAMAQATAEVNIQEVALGPAGSVIVSGTIQCEPGYYYYYVDITVRQRSGNGYKTAQGQEYGGECETSGPVPFSMTLFGEKPFHRGPAAVSWYGELGGDYNYVTDSGTQGVHIR